MDDAGGVAGSGEVKTLKEGGEGHRLGYLALGWSVLATRSGHTGHGTGQALYICSVKV